MKPDAEEPYERVELHTFEPRECFEGPILQRALRPFKDSSFAVKVAKSVEDSCSVENVRDFVVSVVSLRD